MQRKLGNVNKSLFDTYLDLHKFVLYGQNYPGQNNPGRMGIQTK